MPTPPHQPCAECGAPLASDQRYCLSCGARRGPRPPALEHILAGLRSPAPVPPPASVSPPRRVLPGPRVAAVLTLAMLAFGTVAGAAASGPGGVESALRRGPLTLLVPAPPAPAPLASAAPPPAAASPTPEPAPSEPPPPPEPLTTSSGHSTGGSHHTSSHSGASPGTTAPRLPPVRHVFLIVLADESYAQTFGPESPAPYIAHTLEGRGELLVRFYAVAHEELADEVALVSGLGPTPQTAADCPLFTDIIPGQANSQGQYTGQGCIYPTEAQTVGEQLAAKGLTWRVYAEGMQEPAPPVPAPPTAALTACRHPEFGAADPTSQAPQGIAFATFRDPFTYFDGVLHSPACARDDVGLRGLAGDLRHARTTPTLSYIVPDLCHDGRPTPCALGAPAGLPAAEAWLQRVVPEILASPAYRHGGLLILTTDQAPAAGKFADSSSCCEQPRFPAPAASPSAGTEPGGAGSSTGAATTTPSTAGSTTTATTPAAPPSGSTPTSTVPTSTAPAATVPGATTPASSAPAARTPSGITLPPSGGGQVGALLLSPYVKPGTYDQEPFNDFSLLRTIEDLFGLPHLGYAASPHAGAFEASVFSAHSG